MLHWGQVVCQDHLLESQFVLELACAFEVDQGHQAINVNHQQQSNLAPSF